MNEGYFPILSSEVEGIINVENKQGTEIGHIRWKEEWGCYVFSPSMMLHNIEMGPAFTAELTAQMIRLEAYKRKKDKLRINPKVKELLRQAAKTLGTYENEQVLGYIEESLTIEEYEEVNEFLTWLNKGQKTYGHNLAEVWDEWRVSKDGK